MKITLIILSVLSCYRPAWAETALFDYDDFGPQILAHEVIGFQWYQWNSTGDSDPNKIDTVKIVVYWDEPIEKIKEKYPVDPGKEKDYRYLSYEKAMEYLGSSISKLPEATHLIETRAKLRQLRHD
jgi:hypothetical protein